MVEETKSEDSDDEFFDDGLVLCKPCSYKCATCKDLISCLTCPDAINNRVDNPILMCPCSINYFDNGITSCLSCHPSCLTCSGTGSNECLSCPD